jgi:hypothetical protein
MDTRDREIIQQMAHFYNMPLIEITQTLIDINFYFSISPDFYFLDYQYHRDLD